MALEQERRELIDKGDDERFNSSGSIAMQRVLQMPLASLMYNLPAAQTVAELLQRQRHRLVERTSATHSANHDQATLAVILPRCGGGGTRFRGTVELFKGRSRRTAGDHKRCI